MKEFKVNDFLILKLEEGRTNIYINGELFQQCKFLLINIPPQKVTSFDNIESIDEAADNLGWNNGSQEKVEYIIDPETEFLGHCSNLQAWMEHDYDTRLLHRKIAFPLLKKLTDVGDIIAKKAFKEEIAKRFLSCDVKVMLYLLNQNYLKIFNKEELRYIFQELDLQKIIREDIKDVFPLLVKLDKMGIDKTKRVLRAEIKEELAKIFLSSNVKVMLYLLNQNYLKIFYREELRYIFQELDLQKITSEDIRDVFPLLVKLDKMGIDKNKGVLKREIVRRLMGENIMDFMFIVDNGFFRYLTKEKIRALFSNPNFKMGEIIMKELESKNNDISHIIHSLTQTQYISFIRKYDLEFYKLFLKKGIKSGKISAFQSLEPFIKDLTDKEIDMSLSGIDELDVLRLEAQNFNNSYDRGWHILEKYQNKNPFLISIYNRIGKEVPKKLKNAIFKSFREGNLLKIIEIFMMKLINKLSEKDIRSLLEDKNVNIFKIFKLLREFLTPDWEEFSYIMDWEEYIIEYGDQDTDIEIIDERRSTYDARAFNEAEQIYFNFWEKVENFIENLKYSKSSLFNAINRCIEEIIQTKYPYNELETFWFIVENGLIDQTTAEYISLIEDLIYSINNDLYYNSKYKNLQERNKLLELIKKDKISIRLIKFLKKENYDIDNSHELIRFFFKSYLKEIYRSQLTCGLNMKDDEEISDKIIEILTKSNIDDIKYALKSGILEDIEISRLLDIYNNKNSFLKKIILECLNSKSQLIIYAVIDLLKEFPLFEIENLLRGVDYKSFEQMMKYLKSISMIGEKIIGPLESTILVSNKDLGSRKLLSFLNQLMMLWNEEKTKIFLNKNNNIIIEILFGTCNYRIPEKKKEGRHLDLICKIFSYFDSKSMLDLKISFNGEIKERLEEVIDKKKNIFNELFSNLISQLKLNSNHKIRNYLLGINLNGYPPINHLINLLEKALSFKSQGVRYGFRLLFFKYNELIEEILLGFYSFNNITKIEKLTDFFEILLHLTKYFHYIEQDFYYSMKVHHYGIKNGKFKVKYKISEDLNSLKLEKYDGKEYLFEPNTFSVLAGLSSDSHEIRERTLLYIKNWRPKIHDEILESYLKSNLEQKKKIENSLKNFLLHNHKRKRKLAHKIMNYLNLIN